VDGPLVFFSSKYPYSQLEGLGLSLSLPLEEPSEKNVIQGFGGWHE
jgi:hypothetical protein